MVHSKYSVMHGEYTQVHLAKLNVVLNSYDGGPSEFI